MPIVLSSRYLQTLQCLYGHILIASENIQSTLATTVHPIFSDPNNIHTQGDEPDLSRIWKPDNSLHGVEDQMDPRLSDEMLEDDEARVFYQRDIHHEYYIDPEMASNLVDPFDGVYKELPKKHHGLRKVVLFVAGKGRSTYIYRKCRTSCVGCLPVKPIGMQNILGNTYGTSTHISLH
ncbi:hypothetical protein SEVIR_3G312045v4 [Setaria viridis]